MRREHEQSPSRRHLRPGLFLCWVVLGALSGGCPGSSPRPQTLAHPSAQEPIYSRQELLFANVRLWKPAIQEGGIEFTFAPLIVQEANASDRADPEPLVLSYFSDAAPAPDAGGASAGADALAHSLSRISYTWQSRDGLSGSQGIRITVGTQGQPILWESLVDSSGKRIVYASMALEKAAAESWGDPLPGRRYSIEPSLDAAPDLIVARVLEDGPVPMGPIVYLPRTNSDVATVICRCMPSQAASVTRTLSYEIRAAPHAAWTGGEVMERLRWPKRTP